MPNSRSEDQTVITISMSRALLRVLDQTSLTRRQSRAELIREAIAEYLNLPAHLIAAPMRLKPQFNSLNEESVPPQQMSEQPKVDYREINRKKSKNKRRQQE